MPSAGQVVTVMLATSAAEAYLAKFWPESMFMPTRLSTLCIIYALINVTLYLLYSVFIYPLALQPLRKLPGPSGGNLLFGHSLAMFGGKGWEPTVTRWINDIPNDGLLYLRGHFNMPFLLPTSHEMLKAVMSDHADDYEKPGPPAELLRRFLGNGLLMSTGDTHKFQRKHLTPAFHINNIRELYPLFWSKSGDLIRHLSMLLQDGKWQELNFSPWAMRVTLDVIGVAALGTEYGVLANPDQEIVKDWHNIIEPSTIQMLWFALHIILPHWFAGFITLPVNRRNDRIAESLRARALRTVRDHRSRMEKNGTITATKDASQDILSRLIASNNFTDLELADQVLTFTAAGHETTANSLQWATVALSLNPEVQTRLREEIRAALASPTSGNPISWSTVDSLPLLHGVCNEVLRLYPPVSESAREAMRDTMLGCHAVAKGTIISVEIWAINRSKHFWGDDAEVFRPERWFDVDGKCNQHGGATSNYANMTFLHGTRGCIGQGFSKAELKCLIAAVVGHFEFTLVKPIEEYYPTGLITVKPACSAQLKMRIVPGW